MILFAGFLAGGVVAFSQDADGDDTRLNMVGTGSMVVAATYAGSGVYGLMMGDACKKALRPRKPDAVTGMSQPN